MCISIMEIMSENLILTLSIIVMIVSPSNFDALNNTLALIMLIYLPQISANVVMMGQARNLGRLIFQDDYLKITFKKDSFDSIYLMNKTMIFISISFFCVCIVFKREIIFELFINLNQLEIYFYIIFANALGFLLITVVAIVLLPRIYSSY